MSEEATAFARRNELDDPFPIVPDSEPAAFDAGEPHDAASDTAVPQSEPLPDTEAPPRVEEFDDTDRGVGDPAIAAIHADDASSFLCALVGIAARDAQAGATDTASLGVTLAKLGQALAEGQDEHQALADLVDAFERHRLGETGLLSVAPIVAIFTARLIGAANVHETSPDPAETENLLRAAEDVVGAALQSGGARAWRRLPEIATTIARRGAQRGLSIGELAAALPRLVARFGAAPFEAKLRVVASSDQPRGDAPRSGAAGKPRRMLISGPVEIVILDR
jgi:hypothetical protein